MKPATAPRAALVELRVYALHLLVLLVYALARAGV
jgi:hypothetical protein